MIYLTTLLLVALAAIVQIWMHVGERLSPDLPPHSLFRRGAIELGLSFGLTILVAGVLFAAGALLSVLFEILRPVTVGY